MAHRRHFPDEDTKTELICDTDSDEYVQDTGIRQGWRLWWGTTTITTRVIQTLRKWGLQSQADQTHVHQFAGGDRGKKQKKAPHIHKDSSPLCFLMLYFTSVLHVLLTQTKRYYHQHLDRNDRTPNPLPDIINPEMFLFLAITVWMGHNICERPRDHERRTE